MIIEAEIQDSMHLKLLQPVDGERGERVVLEILDPEREEFLETAAMDLERCYGEDEPDYSNSGVPLGK